MGKFKKVALLGGVLVLAGAGTLYYVLSRDHHDASEDSVAITPPPPGDGASKGALSPETRGPASPPKVKSSVEGIGRGGMESSLQMDESMAMPAPVELLVGSRIDLTLSDQFDEPTSISPETEMLVLGLSKTAADTIRFYLDEQEPGFLSERKAVFIADISPIPVLVRNLALRTLKKRSYQTLLIYDSEMAAALKSPGLTDEISIVKLRENEVVEIQTIETRDELHAVLNAADAANEASPKAAAGGAEDEPNAAAAAPDAGNLAPTSE